MGDVEAVVAHCRQAAAAGRLISHSCARTIAALTYSGDDGYAFVSTGTITYTGPEALLAELVAGNGCDSLPEHVWDALSAYLTDRASRGETGPVPGWARLWVR